MSYRIRNNRDFLHRDVGSGGLLGRIGEDVVVRIRAAQRQCAEGHRLARTDILVRKGTRSADCQVVATDHAGEGCACSVDGSGRITIINLITGGDTGNRDFLCKDLVGSVDRNGIGRESVVAVNGQTAESGSGNFFHIGAVERGVGPADGDAIDGQRGAVKGSVAVVGLGGDVCHDVIHGQHLLIDRQICTVEDQIIVGGCSKRTLRNGISTNVFACIAGQRAGQGVATDQTADRVSQARVGFAVNLALGIGCDRNIFGCDLSCGINCNRIC